MKGCYVREGLKKDGNLEMEVRPETGDARRDDRDQERAGENEE